MGISHGPGRPRRRPGLVDRGRRQIDNALHWRLLLQAVLVDAARGEPMIGVAPKREQTLEAVRRISIAGRGAPTASALLEHVCTAVAETFEFDSVAAVLCDASEEVRKTL